MRSILKSFTNFLNPGSFQCPTGEVTIDWTHPLAFGLGYFRRLSDPIGPVFRQFYDGELVPTANTRFGIGPAGPGLTASYLISTTNAYSFAASALPLGGTVAVFVTRGATSFRGAFALSIFNMLDWNGTLYAGFETGSGGGDIRVTATSVGAGSYVYACSWSISGTSMTTKVFQAGKLLNSRTDVNGPNTTTATLVLGCHLNQSNVWCTASGDAVYSVAIWNRPLLDSEISYYSLNPSCFLVPAEYEMPMIRFGAQWQLYFSKNSGAYQPVTTTSVGVKSADASTDADETKILIPRL